MLRFIKPLILICILTSFGAEAADGGTIKMVNHTNEKLDITWSGFGCFGTYNELVSVCASVVLLPTESSIYTYDWGVMTTWINISNAPSGAELDPHACSPGYGDNPNRPKKCLYDHQVVSTDSGEVDICTVTHPKGKPYNMDCYRK